MFIVITFYNILIQKYKLQINFVQYDTASVVFLCSILCSILCSTSLKIL